MKRLRIFGCSYTSYAWPSYAELLCYHFDGIEQWAEPGLGNRAIAELVSECHVRNPITKDDTVLIQWSSHLRNDWYHVNNLPDRLPGWQTAGSIFNYKNQTIYDRKWIETFFHEPAYFMHTLNFISLVQGLLDSIGCTWYMTSIGDISKLGADIRDRTGYGEKTGVTKYVSKEKTAWDIIPHLAVYREPLFENRKDRWLTPLELHCQKYPDLTFDFLDEYGESFIDLHPSPAQSRIYIEQEMKNKLALPDEYFNQLDDIVSKIMNIHKKYKSNKRVFEHHIGKLFRDEPQSKKIFRPNLNNFVENTGI